MHTWVAQEFDSLLMFRERFLTPQFRPSPRWAVGSADTAGKAGTVI